jgi:uncharacterized protein YciI
VFIRFLPFALLLSSFMSAQQSSPTPPGRAKFELETFHIAIMKKASGSNENQQVELSKEHQSYWQRIAEKGDLLLAGPITDRGGDLAAVMIFRATTKDEALRITTGEPNVKSKQWTAEVYPWLTQKGVLPGIKKYDPATSYFLGFLVRGDKFTSAESPERQRIQEGHMANMKRLADAGKLVAGGPFAEDIELRGIFVFKTATLDEANELTNTDPAVQAGR